jgi:hypothetical protein
MTTPQPDLLTATAILKDSGKPPIEYSMLMNNIRRGQRMFEKFQMTPEVAKAILAHHNTNNRPMRAKHLTDLSREMRDGRWRLTGEAIIFGKDLRLLNGQHRLTAVVNSGVTIVTDIRAGIEEDTFAVIDRGKVRDAGDVLSIAGMPNPTRLGRAIRWAYTFEQGAIANRGGNLTPEEVLELAEDRYPTMSKFLSAGQAIYKLGDQQEGMVSGFLFIINRANHSKAVEFSEAWRSNQWGGKYGAIGTMHKALGQMKARFHRPMPMHRAYMLVTCWNHFLRGRTGTLKSYIEWDGKTMPALKTRGYAHESIED